MQPTTVMPPMDELRKVFREAGLSLTHQRVVLYRAVMLDGLTLPVLEALEARTVAAVLLYSARSAQAFLKAVENSGLRADFSGVHALCIADSVLESVQGVDWAGIHVAPTPDQSGMLALIESMKNPA